MKVKLGSVGKLHRRPESEPFFRLAETAKQAMLVLSSMQPDADRRRKGRSKPDRVFRQSLESKTSHAIAIARLLTMLLPLVTCGPQVASVSAHENTRAAYVHSLGSGNGGPAGGVPGGVFLFPYTEPGRRDDTGARVRPGAHHDRRRQRADAGWITQPRNRPASIPCEQRLVGGARISHPLGTTRAFDNRGPVGPGNRDDAKNSRCHRGIFNGPDPAPGSIPPGSQERLAVWQHPPTPEVAHSGAGRSIPQFGFTCRWIGTGICILI